MTKDALDTQAVGARLWDSTATLADEADGDVVDLWFDLQQASTVLRGGMAQKLDEELGLLPEEVELLLRLSGAPEQRLRMVEISAGMLVSKSGATRLVDRLEERGMVVRAACPSDRRVVYAGLTAQGRDALTRGRPVFASAVGNLLGRHVDPAGVEELRRQLRAVIDGNEPDGDRTASERGDPG